MNENKLDVSSLSKEEFDKWFQQEIEKGNDNFRNQCKNLTGVYFNPDLTGVYFK